MIDNSDSKPPRPRGQGWVAMWQVVAEAIRSDKTTVRFCIIVVVLASVILAAIYLLHATLFSLLSSLGS